MQPARPILRLGATLCAAAAAISFAAVPADAAPRPAGDADGPALARQLTRKVTIDAINRNFIALQRFADRNGGNRAASTNGHKETADYIANKLTAAGFDVTKQEFPFLFTQTLAEKLTVAGKSVPIVLMTYSTATPAGGITAPLGVVPAGTDTTPGCEATDYAGVDVSGKIALIKRGGCAFALKQQLAADAGAVGAVIYNNVDGALNGTLGDPSTARIPTGGISKADGEALSAQQGAATVLDLRELRENRTSVNVIAETKTGRKDNVVLAGSHVDSTLEGPGVNDGGSGGAMLLEIALQLGAKPKVNNAVRFGFWSAEEFGIVGSTAYVNSLSFEQQLDIAMYLNFDMMGSQNAGYFVFDGDNSDGANSGPAPFGSAQIEKLFADRFASRGVQTEGTPFDGRTDYVGFMNAGIPVGGTFTGAEELKTAAQAAKWGGQAGVAFDPCYHLACDNLGNINRVAAARNADATAWVIGTYATSTEGVNGVQPRADRARLRAQRSMAAAAPANPAALG